MKSSGLWLLSENSNTWSEYQDADSHQWCKASGQISTTLTIRPHRPRGAIALLWTQTTCSCLVVLDPDHVELSCWSGPRPCGVIWLFWPRPRGVVWLFSTQTMWNYLAVLNPDHVELFDYSGPRPRRVIWSFWTQTTCSYLFVLDPDHMQLLVCSGPRPRAVIWLF